MHPRSVDADATSRKTGFAERTRLEAGRLLFAGSADGGRALATWMSIIQSARLNEIEPWAYVRDILTRLAERRDGRPVDLAELLPEAWIDVHPEYRLPLSR